MAENSRFCPHPSFSPFPQPTLSPFLNPTCSSLSSATYRPAMRSTLKNLTPCKQTDRPYPE
jgi:hypothetical protein